MIAGLNLKVLRTVVGYAALAVGVTVGGVAIGAIVIAPAVSRGRPLVERALGITTTAPKAINASKAVERTSTNEEKPAVVTAIAPFTPMSEAIAAAKTQSAAQSVVPARPSRMLAVRLVAARTVTRLTVAVVRIPKVIWVFLDIAAVLTIAGIWLHRRRRPAGSPTADELARRATAALPAKLVSGKGSRTPRAVMALAESGASPADIARRTGLSLDAVVMCLSMGSFGARQLQPPAA